MSEKRVNIKITASTSDFDKAIKKAQNQIEKLTKTIEDLGDGKFGDKLEKQLKSVDDAAEKIQKNLEKMQDSLDDVSKSKVDKLEDKLDNVSDSVKDLNDGLEDTADSLSDLSKSKIDKLKKQFENAKEVTEKLEDKIDDVIDSLKDMDRLDVDNVRESFEDVKESSEDIRKRINDLLDSFDKFDSQDLNKLEDEFEQVKKSIDDLGTELRDTMGDLGNYLDDAISDVNLFDNTIDDIDTDKFLNIEDSMRDLDKYIDEAHESMRNFNEQTNSLDTNEIENYSKFMDSIDGSNKKITVDTDVRDKSGKGGFASDLTTEMFGAGVVANRVSSAIQDLEKSIDKVSESMRDASTPIQEVVKDYQDLVNNMIKVQKETEIAEQAQSILTEQLENKKAEWAECAKKLEDYKEKVLIASDEEIRLGKSITETEDKIKKFESALIDVENKIEDYSEELKKAQALGEKGFADFDVNNLEKAKEAMSQLKAENRELIDDLREYASIRLDNIAEDLADVEPKVAKLSGELRDLFMSDKGATNSGFADWIRDINITMSDLLAECERIDFKAFLYGANYIETFEEELEYVIEDIEKLEESLNKTSAIAVPFNRATKYAEGLAKAQEKLNKLESSDEYKEYLDNLQKLEKLKAKQKEAQERADANSDTYYNTEEEMKRCEERMQALTKGSKVLEEQLGNMHKKIAEGNDIAREQGDAFNEQFKLYEKLSDRVKNYLEDERNAIILREKVARSFRDVSDAMEKVYSGSSKYDNADLINSTLEEAAKYIKELNVVSTDNLQRDLNRLGEIIEDKTDKIKRFKEYNKEFGSDANKSAYGIEKQGEALKKYADSMEVVVRETNILQKAWGDISVGDVDHLQLRPRIELLDDYEKKLKSAADKIKEFYSETQGPMTQEQQTTLEDWRIWEKNADKLKEYNRALEEYFTTIMDSGGNIDSRFLDELGKFDVAKFAKEFEKMGTTSVVLQKQFNANKIALQEWLQTEKEYRQEAVKSAKAALDQAKNNKALAESQEEVTEATKKVKEAQEDLKKAKEALKNFNKDASANVKELNEMAEALRKIGMAAEDLGKEDIAKFDKSLASMLDHLKTFDNDLPKTFRDFREDLKAVFMDMDGLDFGGVFDGLKDIGAGLLDKIPTKFKIAAGAAGALAKAMKECADIGVNQFYKGMDTVQNALSGFINVARDVGQEVVSAFENITGFDMDFSSLIEVPIEFEAQMKRVGAIAGVVGDEFDKLEEKARTLGATTPFSASEVAEAMEYMGQAGWGYQEIMDGIEGVLSLSTIAEMELGKAAEFVTDTINTFPDMEVKDAAHLIDVLAEVSVKTSTSVAQMQRAFTNCAPVAGTLGISVEDLSMALGLMANQGVKGAKAGTAMKNLMTNLSAPTQKQLDFIKEFNLEGAQQAIVTGDLIGGIKQMKTALKDLSPKQKNAVISTIAGKEALSGVSALLNTTTDDIASLETAMKECGGSAAEMAGEFEQTLKGALNNLAGALEETTLQIFDKVEGSVASVINELTTFINILNGIEQSSSGLTGVAGAFQHLEEVTRGWSDKIATGLTNAIASLDDFINEGALDNLLHAGTHIINGIAKGIRNAAENGTLQSAITGAIEKIGTWFSENLETVVKVGKIIIDAITEGIRENSDLIGDIIKQVTDMQIEIDEAIAYEKGLLFGENFFTFFTKGIETKVSEWGATISGFFDGLTTDFAKNAKMGTPTTNSKKKSNKKTSTSKKTVTDEVANQMNKGKVKTDKAASEIGKGISDNILKKLETMDAGELKELNQEMKNLQNTVKSMSDGIGKSFGLIRESARTEIVGMTNIFRNQFVNMTNITRNQMINVSNIIRNQAVNWSNIIRNQITNARNAFTSQMISMASVARTQLVNVTNIIRNQSINWYNIINNQAKKARDAFTSQMMSMVKVARNQMYNVVSTVRSYMTQLPTATNRTMSMSFNISRNITTNYLDGTGSSALSADALYAANNASTFSLGNNVGTFANSASYAMSTGSSSSGSSIGSGGGLTIEIPVMLDGRQLAKASAKYVDDELKSITKRENRKRGAR